jgi:pimeloyl-ACP methyl ester carboxylesterase
MGARRPDLIRSLMLLETSSDPEPVENLKRYRLLIKIVKLFGPRVVKSRVAPIMLGTAILTDPARKADVERFTALMSRRPDGWRAVNGVIDRAPIHAELGRIKIPTLVVVGDQDIATPIPKAEKIVAAIAGAKLVKIARAGHSSPVEEPHAVTEALTTFLSSLS